MGIVFMTHARCDVVSLCVFLPGWVTTSLVGCGSKAPGSWAWWVWVARTFDLIGLQFLLFLCHWWQKHAGHTNSAYSSPLSDDEIPFMRSMFSFSPAVNLPTSLTVKKKWFPHGRTIGCRQSTGGHQDRSPHISLFEKTVFWKGMPEEVTPERSWHFVHLNFVTSWAPRCQTGRKTLTWPTWVLRVLTHVCFEDEKPYGALSMIMINYKSSHNSLEN